MIGIIVFSPIIIIPKFMVVVEIFKSPTDIDFIITTATQFIYTGIIEFLEFGYFLFDN